MTARVVLKFSSWFIPVLLVISFLQAPTWAQETPVAEPSGFRGSEEASSVRGDYADIFKVLDRFWMDAFENAGIPYRPPEIMHVTSSVLTDCGRMWPEEENAYYCPSNSTIYLFPQWLDEQTKTVGDYAPVTIIAHEWGHHIQRLLALSDADKKAFERQADCLSGAFTSHADESGLLDAGDFFEAIDLIIEFGDDALGLPLDNPGAHGTSEERIKSLMKGYGGGPIFGCEILSGTIDLPPPPPPSELTLPDSPPLGHANCFRTEDNGTYDFDQLAARLGATDDARDRLQDWGWQESVYRVFVCDTPPMEEAGRVYISLHRFATAVAAQQAVDYFASVRTEGTTLGSVDPPAIGDYSAAHTGPTSDGKEFTVYASQGPLLIRVTGVSSSGIPFGNVLTVTQSVLAAQQEQPQPTPTLPADVALLPASAYLPASPAVNYAECFFVLADGSYSYSDVAAALLPTGLTQSQLDGLGWQDGAYRVFTCEEPPSGRATQIDVGIHQFQDAASAQQALPYYSGMYELGKNKTRGCDTAASLVICVSGRSLSGSPLSDVHFVLNQVIHGAE